MLLQKTDLVQISSVRHEGKVVVLGLHQSGQIFYTVKREGFEEDLAGKSDALKEWEDWTALELPSPADGATDESVVARERETLLIAGAAAAQGPTPNWLTLLAFPQVEPFIHRSRYHTAGQNAHLAVQAISAMGHLYVFRETDVFATTATPGSILVDRFVLDGLTNKLVRKLDIRFKRSRRRHEPANPGRGTNAEFDALDFKDANGQPFFEPTTELDFLGDRAGGFAVVVTPGKQLNEFRWHFVTTTQNRPTPDLEQFLAPTLIMTSIRASEDGLFDVTDRDGEPGIVQRVVVLKDQGGSQLEGVGTPVATLYDRQAEIAGPDGPQLVRIGASVMVCLPLNTGVVALSFEVQENGSLGLVDQETPATASILKADIKSVPLPALDGALAFARRRDPITGSIPRIRRGADGKAVLDGTSFSGALKPGMRIRVDQTQNYNGEYTAERIPIGTIPVALNPGATQLTFAQPLREEAPEGTLLSCVVRVTGIGGARETAVELQTSAAAAAGAVAIPIRPAPAAIPANTTLFLRDSLVLDRSFPSNDFGFCHEVIPDEENKVAEGEIAAVSFVPGVRLRVDSPGHATKEGEGVKVSGALDLAGTHKIRAVRGKEVELDTPWTSGRLEVFDSRQRRGLEFDGEDDSVTIPLGSNFPLEGDLTFELWLKPRPGSSGTIALFTNPAATGFFMEIFQTSDLLIIGSTGGQLVAPLLPVNEFHHLALTVERASATGSVFLDGSRIAEGAFRIDAGPDITLLLGTHQTGPLGVNSRFSGTMADVRIWNRVRSSEEIQEGARLALQGREQGLEGYWKLSAINAGNPATVADFGPLHAHGLLEGDPFVTELLLARKLRDGRPAFSYEVSDLVPVLGNGRYTESFEYRLEPSTAAVPPNLFRFHLFGKRRRSEDTLIEFDTARITSNLDVRGPDASGFRLATVNFQVPADVTLLRAFAIEDLQGDWTGMQVRKHRLELISNSITQHSMEESVSIGADEFSGSAELSALYEQSAQLQETEALLQLVGSTTLEQRKNDLRAQRDKLRLEVALSHPVAIRAAETVQSTPIAQIEGGINTTLLGLVPRTTESEESRFFFTKVRLSNGPAGITEAYLLRQTLVRNGKESTVEIIRVRDVPELRNSFGRGGFFNGPAPSFIDMTRPVGSANVDQIPRLLYDIRPEATFNEAGVAVTIRNLGGATERDEWLTLGTDGSGRLTFFVTSFLPPSAVEPRPFVLVRLSEVFTNPEGPFLQAQLDRVERELARLEGLGTLPDLGQVQALLGRVNGDIAARIANASNTIPSAPKTADGSARVSAAHLRSITVAIGSSMSLVESVLGKVVLAYVEALPALPADVSALTGPVDVAKEGRYLRQISYDTRFDQWEPYAFQQGINVAGRRRLFLPGIPLSENWTVEFWFCNPLLQESSNSTSVRSTLFMMDTGQHIAVMGSKLFALVVDGAQYGTGIDLNELPAGWHHLAVVARGQGPVPDKRNIKDPATRPSSMQFYVDGGAFVGDLGVQFKAENPEESALPADLGYFQGRIIAIGRGQQSSRPIGKVAEFRVWNGALSVEEIESCMSTVCTGNEPGLVACYRLNGDLTDSTGNFADAELANGSVPQDVTPFPNMGARISRVEFGGCVTSAEYTTFSVDPASGARTAMMRRFTGVLHPAGARLLSDQRIEDLELRFVGNAQFRPTLLGYIEGPPPVPSENLTVAPDSYAGATSVATVQSTDVEFSWNRSKESNSGASFDFYAGLDIGVEEGVAVGGFVSFDSLEAKIGLKGSAVTDQGTTEGTSVSASAGAVSTNRIELRGEAEAEPAFPVLGRRFVPKNVGYALVISALADVFIARLKKSQRMVAYQVLPVPNIPPDVNTITFFLNPAYVLNGSLDGQVGTAAASARFHSEVPSMRSQYGSLFPASYFRLREAVDLKRQIQLQDARRAAYFENFDARLALDFGDTADQAVQERINNPKFDAKSTKAGGGKDDAENQEKLDKLSDSVGELKEQLGGKQEQLQSQIDAKNAQLAVQLLDPERKTRALLGFAAWQKRMEDLQIRAGKRNIVNTYVWDADGGLHSETEQFASTIEHTIGSSISLEGALGAAGELTIGAVGLEFTGQGTFKMTQTLSKTERVGASLSVEVDVSGIESAGITDAHGRAVLPGEKVHRFRFNTFYLENSKQNFDDFFSYVVDPEWLASNDEQARALRQVDRTKKNEVWRVLHRVTSVERPALSGFGTDARPVVAPVAAKPSLEDQVTALVAANQELREKLDAIAEALSARAVGAGG